MMESLLREVSIPELAAIFARNQDRSSTPHLRSFTISRVRRLATKNGLWEDLNRTLDPDADITVIKRSVYRSFKQNGNRVVAQGAFRRRNAELDRAATALWLGHPKGDVDYLQDLLWAYCDDWTWVMSAHEGRAIDLRAANQAAMFAEILYALADQLEDEVVEHVKAEIDSRIFRQFCDYTKPDPWKTTRNNWNHVCNGAIVRTALLLIDDPRVLAHLVHSAIVNMTYALDGFTDDGDCVEGPGYWSYGFGNYIQAAYALYTKTDGELNLMRGEKIKRICRYPLATQIAGRLRSTFGDSSHGYVSALNALQLNTFHELQELYSLCHLHPDRTLRVRSMHELALYDGQKVRANSNQSDYFLPDLGQVKLRGKPGKKQITLIAIAGHNGVNHNHNDIGSFLLHRGDRIHLADPGSPVYSAKTFSSQRYESVFCNSFGHSVPVINGRGQSEGSTHLGRISVENLNGQGEKRAVIDLTRAYPRGTVKNLVRTFLLGANRLLMEDTYTFTRSPSSVEEAFITLETATVARNGRSVQIGPKTKGLLLSALESSGRFRVERLVEASKESRGDQIITRISFKPEKLGKEMCLKFEMK